MQNPCVAICMLDFLQELLQVALGAAKKNKKKTQIIQQANSHEAQQNAQGHTQSTRPRSGGSGELNNAAWR